MISLNKSWFPQMDAIMKEAFPMEERRTSKEQEALFENPHYHVYGLEEDGLLLAFLAAWEFDNFIFGEHLATHASKRGSGIGKVLLEEFRASITKPIILEVEKPDYEMAKRRIGFYERLGFHLYDQVPYEQPSFHHEAPLPLHLMSDLDNINEQQLKQYINHLYVGVYQETAPWNLDEKK